MRLLQRKNADHAAAGAVILEAHTSRDLGENRVVFTAPRVDAGLKAAAALPTMIVRPSRGCRHRFHAEPLRFESRPLRELPCPFCKPFQSSRLGLGWVLIVVASASNVARSPSNEQLEVCP